MGDKKQETITKYLGDMKSVVSHVYTAMERQKDEFKDQADVSQAIARVALSLKRQDDQIGDRLTALGGSPTHPVKEVVSDAFGVVAGKLPRGGVGARVPRDSQNMRATSRRPCLALSGHGFRKWPSSV